MKITAIPQLYRNLRRWREILHVLRRYGLADWLSRFQRFPFRHAFKDRAGIPLTDYSREQRVRMALTELGPTFIKLGQILAGRPDLVGAELAEELKRLRANVPPEPIETVEATLAAELGDTFREQFRSIDPVPLAAASIGQVHRAVLRDGRPVVIKVQRAQIEPRMRQDIEVLAGLAQLAERVDTLAAWGPREMVKQLAPMIRRELDFTRERQNLELFIEMFRRHQLDIAIPHPVPRLCTRRVLVMEELVGTPLADFLQAADPLPPAAGDPPRPSLRLADRATLKRSLGEAIAEAYLTMIFEEGFFHADPHLGNLIVLDDHRLGILDFGMIGRIDETLRETIEEMLVAIGTGDQNRLTRLIKRVGNPPPKLNESSLAVDTAEFVGTYSRQSLGRFDVTGALNDLSEILHRHRITLPNQSALLLKMLISLEGALRELGAGFDSLDIVTVFLRRSRRRRFSPRRRVRQARRIYLEAENLLEAAPEELLTLLQQVRRGETRFVLEHLRIGPTVNRLVLGMMTSAVFLGSSLLLAFEVPPVLFPERSPWGIHRVSLLGLVGVIGSIVVMLWLLLAINRSGHLTRDNDD